MTTRDPFAPIDRFEDRHLGPSRAAIPEMLDSLGFESLDDLVRAVIPEPIRLRKPLDLPPARSEHEALSDLREIAHRNQVCRSFIGMGYYNCFTPPVIQRNILENPGWYTQYTPYQAEIAQGRLEALMNFQSMVADLTGLPLANASLLDEATAGAEAMSMTLAATRGKKKGFFIAEDCHPQTIAVIETRCNPLGVEVHVGPPDSIDAEGMDLFAALLQYPTTEGRIEDYSKTAELLHAAGAYLIVATDLLALTLLKPPGEFGADITVGSSQRLGVPMGFGGPHAAFLSTTQSLERQLPGRIVGLSKDANGNPAFRLARQTREQHIRREKATSNICTAQVLLAVMASMYAVYYGPRGLRRIGERVHRLTRVLAAGLKRLGFDIGDGLYFDTLKVKLAPGEDGPILTTARSRCLNLRHYPDGSIGISLDETVTRKDLEQLLTVFSQGHKLPFTIEDLMADAEGDYPAVFARQTEYLTQAVFKRYHSEHGMLRYMQQLQERDLSLAHSMISLGSCTMKLNATAEMMPVTWPEFAGLHPFAPPEQAEGYYKLFEQLEGWLAEITGFSAASLQPNAGSQGEFTGLMVIRAYHHDRGDVARDVCLIPTSAHGTNPASSVMAGYKVVPVASDERGDFDLDDLRSKAEAHKNRLAAAMITYPSTHGVFEEHVREVSDIVHENGGLVYLDGANMNAQVGLCHLSDIGADVCHLNLHKTFAIPHGGGGPGVGPICVAEHLKPFLPGHPVVATGGEKAIGPVSAAPFGSPGVLPISWMYIAMMGPDGLKRASQVAILNANYMAKRLIEHYPVVYTGMRGFVAHEFIIDFRQFKESAGITVDDVAKRLMDYGFHAPTMSWPVAGTMMVEPTESESKAELDRLCDALIAIRAEIRELEEGRGDREDNLLRNAPHTAGFVTSDSWPHGYSRETAAYPADWVKERKFWPPVGRIDNVWGDRNLICTCDPVESYALQEAISDTD
ncbi:MAG: aminomethyl-transferring glycine dehydrogenase [Thermoanaerobaculia bacterium]